MPLSKNAKIGLVIAIALAITIPTVIILYPKSTGTGPTITLFGTTVTQTVKVYYSELSDPTNLNQSVNKIYTTISQYGTVKTYNFTGVSLWDLIVYSGVSYGVATAVRFIGTDDYASPAFPIRLLQENPELCILAYEQDGVSLLEDEDGPYRTVVNHSVVDPKISSKYAAKMTAKIEFLDYPDWNITIRGNVANEITIYYADLMTFGYTELNELINYSNQIRNYTGITLKQILSTQLPAGYVINSTPITGINFTGADDVDSYIVNYSWVLQNDTDVLVVYARDFEILDPEDDGYLNSVVDYSLTAPTSSSKYKMKFLLYIEILG
ncbi:MAG TPA: molybdopterin-dependent oxidoreductase [Candidatus Deferrimicrobium sp.]|nr:molybdopterin-dependent oxidoreductase [Candidatus Deferrimicrobium sp.]